MHLQVTRKMMIILHEQCCVKHSDFFGVRDIIYPVKHRVYLRYFLLVHVEEVDLAELVVGFESVLHVLSVASRLELYCLVRVLGEELVVHVLLMNAIAKQVQKGHVNEVALLFVNHVVVSNELASLTSLRYAVVQLIDFVGQLVVTTKILYNVKRFGGKKIDMYTDTDL